jgi:hypothetical protein
MKDSMKTAKSSDTTFNIHPVLISMGIMNHKYGKVAKEAVIPARIMIQKEMLDFFLNNQHNTMRTIVSITIVAKRDFKN